MRMKKILCLLFAAAVSVSMLSACGQETQAQPQTQTETAAAVDEDGQNPVMNFIGNYRSDRCTLLLEADGMSGAKVTAHQTNDAAMATDAAEWELSGEFDEVSMRITYTNAVKKLVSYTQAGEVAGESVVYQNGSGYIRLNDDGTLTWHDDNDPELASRTFGYVLPDDLTQPVEDIPSTTSAPVATTPVVIPQTRVSATAARATGTTKVAPPITTSTIKPAATTATTQPTTTTTTIKPTTTTTKPNATTTTTKPTAATTQPTTKPAASSTTEESVQNPLANYAGTYQAGRCSLTITPNGKNNATITATWGNSASSAAEWKMHASYIEDTQRLTYSDCTKKTTTYDENGNVVEEKVDYSGGVGRLQLFGDGTLRWENEEETDVFAGMVFSRG